MPSWGRFWIPHQAGLVRLTQEERLFTTTEETRRTRVQEDNLRPGL